MKVFVAGGSGVVGERLIPRLIAAGHEVFATTRSQKGIEPLEILGANPLVVDGLDEEAVTKVVSLVRYRFLERLRGAGPQAAAVTDRRRHRRLVVHPRR